MSLIPGSRVRFIAKMNEPRLHPRIGDEGTVKRVWFSPILNDYLVDVQWDDPNSAAADYHGGYASKALEKIS